MCSIKTKTKKGVFSMKKIFYGALATVITMSCSSTQKIATNDIDVQKRKPSQVTGHVGYEKIQSAIQKAEVNANKKYDNSKDYAEALIKLANLRMEARRAGYQCDLGYLSEIVSPFIKALPHSPWLVKNIKTTQVYKNLGKDSLVLQLAANGFYGSKTINNAQLTSIFKTVFKNEDFSLYKPQPGVMSLGQINFSKGSLIDISNTINDNGEFEQIVSNPIPVDVFMDKNGFLKININGRPSYSIVFERDGKVIKDFIVPSTDSIYFRNINEEAQSNPANDISIESDECSA